MGRGTIALVLLAACQTARPMLVKPNVAPARATVFEQVRVFDGTPPWDSKAPNTDAQSAALVYSGVTTILAAARDADIPQLRRRIASGDLPGPRIIGSSRIFTAPGGHPVPMFRALVPWPVSSLVLRSRVTE